MDTKQRNRQSEWRFEEPLLVILYMILLIIQCSCQTVPIQSSQITKRDLINVDNKIDNECHSCFSNNYNKTDVKEQDNSRKETLMDKIVDTVSSFTEENSILNTTANLMADVLENLIEKVLTEERYVITDGIEITAVNSTKSNEDNNGTESEPQFGELEGRALFSKYTYEYRLLQKVKNFFATHAISINLPKAAKLMDFRSFGLNKFFVPLLIGGQIILKSILFTMFLPSILGSFGKILGKGISQLSASSSQASYPPAQMDEQSGYNSDNKDIMGYETNPPGSYVYPQDDVYGNIPENDVNDPENDMSRFGMGGQKASYLPGKNSYYKNQMATANNYKVFQKIPSSSMILSNYDPFYSPLLSRLDGIFARLGLTPSESSDANHMQQIGGQSLSEVKLEACREQLICLMYANPAKYAPYSNLISAQLSRELNELRRPVSDNPEILRFFRYMRAARRGQEGTDCMRAHPACSTNTAPEHTMIAAYHDINKLVTARKMKSFWDWF